MKKLDIVVFTIIATILLIIILVLPNLSVPGSTDIIIYKDDNLYVGEGELCSTNTFSASCQPGLVCATKDGRTKFFSEQEDGWCILKEKAIDLN